MKKLILGALSVLSLGLFSFAPPFAASVWRLPGGNYNIDPGACLNFTPSDQAAVSSLMSQIYKQPFQQPTPVQPLACSCNCGGQDLDTKIAPNMIETKYHVWNNCLTAPGTPEAQLLSIIDRYAIDAP